MRYKRKILVGGVAVALLAAGIGVASAGSVTRNPGAQPTAQSPAEVFSWSRGDNGDIPMRPVDSHVCFLTGFRGDYDEDGALAVHRSTTDLAAGFTTALLGGGGSTHYNENSQNWKLGGWRAGGGDASGNAACVPYSAFVTDPGGITLLSDMGLADVSTPIGFDCDTRNSETKMFDGQSTTFLAGFRGGFYSFSDRVYVKEPAQVNDPARLAVAGEACDLDDFQVSGYSLLVGANGQNRYPNTVGRTSLRADHQQSFEKPLARTRDGICFFKSISGEIKGGGEGASLTPTMIGDEEWWVLRASALGGQVEVAASCLRYDQRDRPEILDPVG